MRLVIAEKPSVARDLAKVLGAHTKKRTYLEGPNLRITWCFGHMCELAEPAYYNPEWKKWRLENLPMLPENFKINVRQDTQEHWSAIANLLKGTEITEVVNACDAGREGELIFRYVIQSSGVNKPTLRLWVSSMTAKAIQHAWDNLQPGENFDNLADAARCRSEADWLVGLNATRAMTCMVQRTTRTKPLSIGRVQTPTLAMIVKRDLEISNFIPETFWRVEGVFSPNESPSEPDDNSEAPLSSVVSETWVARWFRYDPNKSKSKTKETPKKGQAKKEEAPNVERLSHESDAQLISVAAQGKAGTLIEATRKQVTEKTPLLYDLNALQQRANQRFSFSAQKTLDIAQSLYETHKLITYPRSDARYLLPDQKAGMRQVLEGLQSVGPYQSCIETLLERPKLREGKRIYNAKEVGDHHAIIPTGKSPMRASLNSDEKRVFDLIARRLLGALSPDAKFASSKLIVSVDVGEAELPTEITSPLYFQAKGKVCLDRGWQLIDPPPPKKELELPQLVQGQTVYNTQTTVHEGQTRPPKTFNEASLLGAMETAGKDLEDIELKRAMRTAGLGTPATRASIIETLLNRGFIERNKRNLNATDLGTSLIQAITVEELKSAELTGKWEARLSAIAAGQDTRASFMSDVSNSLTEIIETIKSTPPPSVPALVEEHTEAEIGACPKCATPVRARGPVFTCDTGRSCEFVIFNTIASRKISKRMVKQLLNQGYTSHVKGFKSKKSGKTFAAALRLNEDGKVVFDFSQSQNTSPPKSKKSKSTDAKPPVSALPNTISSNSSQLHIGAPCPNCDSGHIIQGSQMYGCSNWRDGCRQTHPITSPVGMHCPTCNDGTIIQGRSAWGCNQYAQGCHYRLDFSDENGQNRSDDEAIQILLRRPPQ